MWKYSEHSSGGWAEEKFAFIMNDDLIIIFNKVAELSVTRVLCEEESAVGLLHWQDYSNK